MKVAAGAAALANSYDEWLNHDPTGGRTDAEALRARLSLLTGPKGQEIARAGWEDARQLFDAVSAYDRSLEAAESDPRTAALVRGLGELLRPPVNWDTPPAYDGGHVVKALQEIHNSLGTRQ